MKNRNIFFGDKKPTGKAVQLCNRSLSFLAKKCHIGLEGTHCGRLLLLVVPAADGDCVAEDIRCDGRAVARVGQSGGGEMVAVEPYTLLFCGIKTQFHGRGDPIVAA